ncbi:MAG: hypothetical protein K2X07_08415 [Caulobacteraceae bacterium]|nr:hypothetical protein [Caulobacteraceae bacterium]
MTRKPNIRARAAAAALFCVVAPAPLLAQQPTTAVLDPGPTGVRIAQPGVFGNYFPARGEGPHPGILLLGGSEGGLGPATLQTALALQDEGFSVLQLAYFGVPGTADSLERIPLEIFDQGLDWLGAQTGVDPNRLAVVGASKGAEAALLVATRRTDLRAVVAGMPSSVVWKGVNWARGGQSTFASWTANGVELPTMPYSAWNREEGIISVYRSVQDSSLREDAAQAAIPIERARAPILLICGQSETVWPACPMSENLATRSQEQGGPPVVILGYGDAGHFVFGPPISSESSFYSQLGMFGGSAAGNASAREDSWPRAVDFLRENTAR